MFSFKKILFLFIFFCFIFESNSQCIQSDALEASPPPMSDPFTGGNPTYFPGQVIEFCYTVESYNGASPDNNNNWMHGIVPLFGPGWDQNSLVPIGQPQSVNQTGEWIWTNNVIGVTTGNLVVEPGWWYDDNSGGGALNGDPGDNYGDGGAGSWTFCWQITVSECPPADNGASLIMEVTNYSDYEMGSFGLEGCEDDPSLYFYANLNCPTCDETDLTVVQPTCETPEGLAFVTPDGEGPWNLTWLDPFGNITAVNNNITGPFSLTGLSPNDYYVIVEDTFDGCLFTIPFTVETPEDPIVDVQVFGVSCFGGGDGAIDINQVGEGTYEYTWTTPSGEIITDEDLNNLVQGDYILEIYNSENFCNSSQVINVPEPSDISVISSISDYSGYGVSCFGSCDGFIGIDIIGGTGFELDPELDDDCVSYEWSADLNEDGVNDFLSSNSNLANLCSGSYNLTVTDCNNCIFSTTFIITEPESELSISETHSDYGGFGVSCNGGSDGYIDLSINGGTAPYTYSWSNSETTESIDNLVAGAYSVNVTDENGCSVDLTIDITEPESVFISNSDISSVSCPGGNDGEIDIEINGGFPPYDLNWSSINGFSSDIEDISGLTTGEYTITIIDNLNCSYEFSFLVSEADPILIQESHEDVSCFGANDGSININLSGGFPPFNYQWSNGELTPNIDNLGPGDYVLIVTDFNDCSQEIEVTIQEPETLTFNVNTFDVTTCFGESTGSAYLTINGGTPPYNQNWYGFNPNALQGGNYLVTVTDANDCVFEQPFTINQPQELSLDIQTTDVLFCYGDPSGTAEIFVNGGTPPYTINTGNLINLNQIPAGTYLFSAIDNNGCEVSQTVEINQPDLLSFSLEIINPLCSNDNSGQAIPNIVGGTPPYSQEWTDLSGIAVNPNTLSPGQYQLTLTDQFNCEATQVFSVFNPEAEPISLFLSDNIYCLNEFTAYASGGFGAGTWSFNGPGNIVFSEPNNLTTNVSCSDYGTYELIYTDECGSVSSIEFDMQAVSPEIADIPDVTCSFSGLLYLSDTFSSQGYWSLISAPNGETATFENSNAQTTVVTVSDYGIYTFAYYSCGSFDEIEIEFKKDPYANFAVSFYDCEQSSSIFVDVPQGVDNGYFEFLDGPGNIIIDEESPNTLDFTVDSWGLYDFAYHLCDTFATVTVGFSCPITVPNAFTPNGDTYNDYFAINGLDFSIHTNLIFTVYNRWGYVVHTQVGYGPDKVLWDGRIADLDNQFVSDGVYYYILEFFNEASRVKEQYQGNIYISSKENINNN